MLLHLHIISGCFCTAWAELSSCSRDRMACRAQNIYILSLYRKTSLLLGIYYKKVSRVTANWNCQHLPKSCPLSYSLLWMPMILCFWLLPWPWQPALPDRGQAGGASELSPCLETRLRWVNAAVPPALRPPLNMTELCAKLSEKWFPAFALASAWSCRTSCC